MTGKKNFVEMALTATDRIRRGLDAVDKELKAIDISQVLEERQYGKVKDILRVIARRLDEDSIKIEHELHDALQKHHEETKQHPPEHEPDSGRW